MKARSAQPTERDLRFVRNTGFRPEDFGQEVRLVNSAVDGGVIAAILIFVLLLIVAAA